MFYFTSVLLSVALFAFSIIADNIPYYDHDPNTNKYCTWWYDNWQGATCASVLVSENVTLTDLVRWNPTLSASGNICNGWTDLTSYCVDVFEPVGTPSVVWAAKGCYVDSDAPSRVLSQRLYPSVGGTLMTWEACQTTCWAAGYKLAGLEGSKECWCGLSVTAGSVLASDSATTCTNVCNGNPNQLCGGSWRMNVFERIETFVTTTTSSSTWTTTPPTTSTGGPISTAIPTWKAEGCFRDEPIIRTLDTRIEVVGGDSTMTNPKCQNACWAEGFIFAGVEKGNECYCGKSIRNEISPTGGCSVACTGASGTTCGGVNLISVWSASVHSLTTTKTTSATPTSTAAVWNHLGCYLDTADKRSLTSQTPTEGGELLMTIPLCQQACSKGGYTYAGVQSARYCWCGNAINGPAISLAECDMPCKGNPSQTCGNDWKSNIYQLGAPKRPWLNMGCYTDAPAYRTLQVLHQPDDSLTYEQCQKVCEDTGFKYAGVETGVECHCGNDIRAPGTMAAATSCNSPCLGDRALMCGGSDRITMFYQPPALQEGEVKGSFASQIRPLSIISAILVLLLV